MRVNLDAVYRITRAALPLLRQSECATVVNVVSTAAQRGEAEHAHYAASKGALVSWTKSLAVELAPGVRVNAVAPGWVHTRMVQDELFDAKRLERVFARDVLVPAEPLRSRDHGISVSLQSNRGLHYEAIGCQGPRARRNR